MLKEFLYIFDMTHLNFMSWPYESHSFWPYLSFLISEGDLGDQ